MIIYKAVHLASGKIYVGQTIEGLNQRIGRHISYGKGPFPRTLRKYGREAFSFEVIDRAITHEELDQKEQEWIARLGSLSPRGYNLTEGGGGTSGWKASPEVRKKIRDAKLGKSPMTAAGRERLRQLRRNGIVSEESRAKMSASQKRRVFSDEHRRRLSESAKGKQAFLGRKHSEETRIKMSLVQKMRRAQEATARESVQ